jgi:hypothetical protein
MVYLALLKSTVPIATVTWTLPLLVHFSFESFFSALQVFQRRIAVMWFLLSHRFVQYDFYLYDFGWLWTPATTSSSHF